MKRTLLVVLAFVSVNAFAQLATEGFEGTWPPAGWAVFNLAGTQETWQQSDPFDPIQQSYEGLYAAQIKSEDITAGTTEDWLVTPQFTVTENAHVRFFSRLTVPGNQSTMFEIRITSGSNQANLGLYQIMQQFTETEINPVQTDYTEILVPIPTAFEGQQVYIAFIMKGDNSDSWLVDNVSITGGCEEPANVTVANNTDATAQVSWTSVGTGSQWEVEVVPVGTMFTGVGIITSSNPFTITGLADYNYIVRVRAICTGGSMSEWTVPTTFLSTVCDPTEQCSYIFNLTDAWNDGWNGNTMSVIQNGSVTATLSMSIGAESTVSVALCDGQPFELFWNSGNFPQEVGISVSNAFGQTVYTKPPGSGTPDTLLFTGPVECMPDFCYPPYNVTSAVVAADATISWSGGSTASGFEYIILPQGSSAPSESDAGFASSLSSVQAEGFQPYTAYDVYVRAVCPDMILGTIYSTWTGPHTFTIGSGNTITGNIMVDSNGDNICNEPDFAIPSMQIEATINGGQFLSVYTNADGEYLIHNLPDGINTVTLQPLAIPGFATITPVTQTIDFSNGTFNENISFCLSPSQAIADIGVEIIPLNNPQPGFNATYKVVVINNNYLEADNVTATIVFNDSRAEFISANAPYIVNGNTITIDLLSLAPLSTSYVDLTFDVLPPPVNVGGEQLVFTGTATMSITDEVPANNSHILTQTIVNSYDPNDITCHQGDAITEDQAGDYLTYTIRFQNTGTANAVNVRLENTLHELLDWDTFQPITASHTYFVTREDNELEFRFDNIQLPAEQEDEPASHGFVTYRVKPVAAFGLGDIVSNTAGIYFDFNPAIITNTATTEVVATMGTEGFTVNNIMLYPNPVTDNLHIKLKDTELLSIKIYDINGREFKVNIADNSVNTSGLSAGIYMVKITTSAGVSLHRIVKR